MLQEYENHGTARGSLAIEMEQLLVRLFPLCRSITGAGVRETLAILRQYIPLDMHEVPSGTKAFDWTVPKEWNIKGASLRGPDGKTIVDFKENNLHVMSYSIPVRARMSLSELKPHLHSLPDQPDLIPYKTSYYKEDWGFCLTHTQLQSLHDGMYEVDIDSTLEDGTLTYGELFVPGDTAEEILVSCYVCHPSMANDNLSGVVLTTFLAREIQAASRRRYSYRFLFIPETIGAVLWLSRNKDIVPRIKHGLVATCVGDAGPFTYKKSRQGNAEIDRVVARVLASSGVAHEIIDFFPLGSDERQYCSPGFNMPVGSLMRSMYYRFPAYHTSGDNLTLVRPEYLLQTLEMYCNVFAALEQGRRYVSMLPYGEPQLGKRGLYPAIGGQKNHDESKQAIMWVLNLSDGTHSLEDIAERSGISLAAVTEAAEALVAHELIREV